MCNLLFLCQIFIWNIYRQNHRSVCKELLEYTKSAEEQIKLLFTRGWKETRTFLTFRFPIFHDYEGDSGEVSLQVSSTLQQPS